MVTFSLGMISVCLNIVSFHCSHCNFFVYSLARQYQIARSSDLYIMAPVLGPTCVTMANFSSLTSLMYVMFVCDVICLEQLTF